MKQLKETPIFKPQRRNKLPKPFKTLGGSRINATSMMDVSTDHVVFMYWRGGSIFTDRSFFAFLFCRLSNGDLSPLFEFHWHPSHKGFHCKTPCKTVENYTNRILRRAPELSLSTKGQLDPKNEVDRVQLVLEFCRFCGIKLPDNDAQTKRLCE